MGGDSRASTGTPKATGYSVKKSSAKGRGGGFSLARPAHEITLVQIVEAVEGPQAYDRCVVGLERCNDQMPCAQHDLYKPIRQRIKDYLTTTTAADLAASLRSKQAWQRAREQAATAAQQVPPRQSAADSAVD